MAKQKILSMPLRVAPYETFELVAFVVNVEFDSAGYDPYDVKPNHVGYKIFDPTGTVVVSGSFDTKLVNGLIMTHHNISLTTPGTYGVFLEDTVEKCYGFTQIHVSTADLEVIRNLDERVSTRASQTSVDAVKAQTDKIQFDANDYIKVNVQDKGVLNDVSVSEIDNQLSSSHGSGSWEGADTSGLAQESTVQAIKSQTDKMQFDASNNILSIAQNSELSNLDATVSSRASQSSVNAIKSQTDKLQFDSNDYVKANVQDKGVLNDPSVSDIDSQLSSSHGSGSWETADTSSLALESTAQSIKTQTDKLTFDANNNVQARVNDKGVLNDPSVADIDNQLSSSHGSGSWTTADVSSLALESTVQGIKGQTDKMQFDSNNYIKANVQDKGVLNDPSVTDIDNQLSSTHGSGSWEGGSGGSCDPSAIADAVWDEATADHVSSGTFGLLMSNIYAKILTIYDKIKKLW